jgi:hypothetical protein
LVGQCRERRNQSFLNERTQTVHNFIKFSPFVVQEEYISTMNHPLLLTFWTLLEANYLNWFRRLRGRRETNREAKRSFVDSEDRMRCLCRFRAPSARALFRWDCGLLFLQVAASQDGTRLLRARCTVVRVTTSEYAKDISLDLFLAENNKDIRKTAAAFRCLQEYGAT